ncbi:MAG: aminopeptidase [Candidatus Hodarchaeales archaeon]
MYGDYAEKLARVIVRYSVNVQEDDLVQINGSTHSIPLIREIYREVLLAGGLVVQTNIDYHGRRELLFSLSSDKQLKYVDSVFIDLYKKINKIISLYTSFNTRELTNIPPEKKAIVAEARKEINMIVTNRAAKKELQWNISPYPCEAFAQEASMGLMEYTEFAYKALNLHRDDPVEYWKRIKEKQDEIIAILDKGSEYHILGKDTDLTLAIDGRKWINGCGLENLPDGEVFTAPHEDGVNGTIRFTYPGIFQGQEIEDIRLTFKDGVVVDHDAAKGRKLLDEIVKIPNANILGELAVGTNYSIQNFTKNMLFDEKIGGTIHLALGMGYPESGSKNQASIHWDILKDMKDPGSKIILDGETIYKEGKWTIP